LSDLDHFWEEMCPQNMVKYIYTYINKSIVFTIKTRNACILKLWPISTL